jgi:MoxR-like ATPase
MSNSDQNLVKQIVSKVNAEVGKSIYGNEEITSLLAGAFLIGGHVLLEGPPGVAKTLIAKCFAKSLALDFNRVQFTPDLMPSDVTGINIFDQASSSFRFAPGPIFADIVLADEINRTPPKTQSALLEAMQERFVTIDGKRHSLGTMFFVIATQNPVEHEGTFPLPEAQLDRFLFKLNIGYPDKQAECSMIQRFSSEMPEAMTEVEQVVDSGVVTHEMLDQGRQQLRRIAMDSSIATYIHDIVDRTRNHSQLILGASPRAALNLALAGKFRAAMEDRSYVIPDDVKRMASHVLAHRIIFEPGVFDAEASAEKIIQNVLSEITVPDGPAA